MVCNAKLVDLVSCMLCDTWHSYAGSKTHQVGKEA
jgi:hypothetical protein